ncbi:MAG: dihydrofolate reductase [Candidatus Nanohaloarchaea archaeon]|nr:dihydrofolate reductase [Candidatus Nanohaloarchaea archaeon]
MEVVIIAAVAANSVIGRDGSLPWELPEDMEHFRATTHGHPVVMGRTTWEDVAASVGGPLPGRTNIVLSHEDLELPAEVVNVHGIDEAFREAGKHGDTVYVIGGASVYRQTLDRADRVVLSELHEPFEGDTFFPELDGDWQEVERDSRDRFDIVTYER